LFMGKHNTKCDNKKWIVKIVLGCNWKNVILLQKRKHLGMFKQRIVQKSTEYLTYNLLFVSFRCKKANYCFTEKCKSISQWMQIVSKPSVLPENRIQFIQKCIFSNEKNPRIFIIVTVHSTTGLNKLHFLNRKVFQQLIISFFVLRLQIAFYLLNC
jgi:hypothetical protein